jgi:GntR family transcriptional regulator of arabinose operon
MPSFISIGKSKQFYNFLRTSLLNEEYKVGDKFPSIRELSEKYEISKPTVNSVISNLVNEGFLTVEQGRGTFVLRTSSELPKENRLIGVIMEEYSKDSNIENVILGYLCEFLQKEGYYIVPINTYNNCGRFYNGLANLMKLEIIGMVILPPPKEDYDIDVVRGIIGELPVVCLNRDLPGCNRDLVQIDFQQCGKLATTYLLEKGRRKILLPSAFGPTLYSMLLSGYRAAYAEAGLQVNDNLTGQFCWNAEETLRSADGLIAPDIDIYREFSVFQECGILLPQDFGIVGVNDSNHSRLCTPPLSSIRFSGEEIAFSAFKLLLKRMKKPGDFQLHSVACELVKRST